MEHNFAQNSPEGPWAPPEAHSSNSTSFVEACSAFAKIHFQISSLRESQIAVLKKIEKSTGILATLPTGAGKTLLYALPALAMQPGLVLVISPLISLMRDQIRRMQQANIPCVLFTSDQNEDERRDSYSAMFSPEMKLIFASPERFALPSFLKSLRKLKINIAVVDEAHCVVSWGAGFRPEYLGIGKILSQLRPGKILALTATAARGSRKYIKEVVFPQGYPIDEVVSSPLAKNVFVNVERVYSETEKWEFLIHKLKNSQFEKAIVYFPKRDLCEESAIKLRKLGLHAISYHAGLSRDQRRSAEIYLQNAVERVVVCATQAFGMGVDVAGVNLVAIYGFPGNIEEYFQMIGRAGRGGELCQSLLIWSGSDPKRRLFQFEASFPDLRCINDSLADFVSLFPARSGQRFVFVSDAKRFLRANEKILPGVLTALRLMSCIEQPAYRENLIEIQMSRDISIDQLLLDLPMGITRRSRVLEALCALNAPEWRKGRGAETVVIEGAVLDEAGFPKDKFLEVLHHYESAGKLKFRNILEDKAKDGFIVKSSHIEAIKSIPVYGALRRQFMESLMQLDRLVEHSHCRLSASESFFSARSVVGASRSKFSCMQCDLCVSRKLNKTGANFEDFQAISAT